MFSWAAEAWSCWQQVFQCVRRLLIVPYLLGVMSTADAAALRNSPCLHSQVSAASCSYKLLYLGTLQFSMHRRRRSAVCVMQSSHISPEFAMPYASHPCKIAVGSLKGAQ